MISRIRQTLVWTALMLATGYSAPAFAQGTVTGEGMSVRIAAWNGDPFQWQQCGSLAEAEGFRHVLVVVENFIGTLPRFGTVSGDWPGWPAWADDARTQIRGQVVYRDGVYLNSWVSVIGWPRGVPYTLPRPGATWASPGFAVCDSVIPNNNPCMSDADVSERGWSASEPLGVLAASGTVTIPLGVASDRFDTFGEAEQAALGWTWLPMEMDLPDAGWTFLHGQATLTLSLADAPEPYEFGGAGWVGVPLAHHADVSLTIPARQHQHVHADLDRNGQVSISDLFTFIDSWFRGDPAGDWDGLGGCAVPDVFAFLSDFFGGE